MCARLLALTAILVLGLASPTAATIISGSVTGGTALADGATFIKLTPPLANGFGPPNSVGEDTFQTPHLYGFDEDQNILLAAPLSVDVGSDPLPVGTVVASHYIFFDPEGARSIVGTVDFDSQVLAIITSTDNLAASDFLANTGVNYLNPTLRGFEAGDSVTISGTNQITFDVTASTPGDYVRVLTTFSPLAVPEPGTLAVAGTAIGAAALRGLRRRAVAAPR